MESGARGSRLRDRRVHAYGVVFRGRACPETRGQTLLQIRRGGGDFARGCVICGMIEEAVSIGEAVPRPGFEAAVQACFDNAVNLRLRGRDRIVTLLVSDHYELPQGI